MTLYEQWLDALRDVEIRHMDPESTVRIDITDDDPPMLTLNVRNAADNLGNPRKPRFVISCVRLDYFPGVAAARAWIAAAWAGYLAHEALEAVTVDGVRVLDPHAEPYETNPYNRGVRDALPPALTPETLRRALAVVGADV